MLKKAALFGLVIGILAIGAVAVYAQQGGNGRGRGGTPDDTPIGQGQLETYRNGGIGFVNPETGEQWNGQQRGRMNRGWGAQGTGMFTSLPPATEGDLPQEIVDLMIEGWVDEQHAYAVYDAVIAEFGEIAPFVNIQQAELQHAAAWEFLFDRYGIETPALPEFEMPVIDSVESACALAAEAEIVNFDLYDTMLEAFADYPDIYQVALSLRNASEFNHLPAFQNCAGS